MNIFERLQARNLFMEDIFLLLGSNIGDREKYLSEAIRLIDLQICKVLSFSSIYETSAWGRTDQPDYLNQVIYLKSDLPASELLPTVLRIEALLGRERNESWGARTIDIDILFYGSKVINEVNLNIPHVLLHKRRFVLMPLNELAPDLIHPVLNKKISELLDDLEDNLSVNKLANKH